MDQPRIARKAPIPVDVEAGKSYFWCACGRSQTQPFCDGSHEVTDLRPLKWTANETTRVLFCCCKQTSGQPFCDGAHKTL